MEFIQRPGEVEILGLTDFDPEKIFTCGQCFRWREETPGVYVGVAMGRCARVRREGESVFISGTLRDVEEVWHSYFDLDRDYAALRRGLCIDEYMTACSDYGAGIRILRQEKWEALCSFIISQCNNIPRIMSIVETLCRTFGDRLEFEGREMYSFPAAECVAQLEEADLAPLRCGYRAKYIIAAARAVAAGDIDMDALSAGDYKAALSGLCALPGVGAKVANCVILFGLQMLDAFPVDVWMKKALSEHYPDGLDPKVFGGYAGLAQQYMFDQRRLVGGFYV